MSGSAIVTDSALRTALFTIRNLGAHGVRITAVERPTGRWADLGGLSRYVTRREVVPDNRTEPEHYADALLELARDHDVLVPVGMHSIEPVSRRLDAFQARTGVALARWEAIARADRTRELLDLARTLGIPVPRSFELPDYPSIAALASDVSYPAYVKSGIEAGLAPRDRYRVVRNAAELAAAVEMMRRVTPTPLIQEAVVGPGIGFEALYDFQHRLVAAFTHRRLRQYPLDGGPSTYCESCHVPLAEAYARRLLDDLQWTGLAMVEFKVDERTGQPVLMEINPRPWGSMALPIRAGVEFPWLAYRLARDGQVEASGDWPDGVRLRYLVNDAQAAAAQWRRARGLGERLAILGSLFDPRVHEGVLTLRDPRPSWAYVRKGFTRAVAAYA